MSESVRLSAKLPGDEEINGLDQLAPAMLDAPEKVICAIVWLDVSAVTTNIDEGTETPTVRVRRIEPIGHLDRVPDAVIALAGELMEARTGRRPLPFDTLEGLGGAEIIYTSGE